MTNYLDSLELSTGARKALMSLQIDTEEKLIRLRHRTLRDAVGVGPVIRRELEEFIQNVVLVRYRATMYAKLSDLLKEVNELTDLNPSLVVIRQAGHLFPAIRPSSTRQVLELTDPNLKP